MTNNVARALLRMRKNAAGNSSNARLGSPDRIEARRVRLRIKVSNKGVKEKRAKPKVARTGIRIGDKHRIACLNRGGCAALCCFLWESSYELRTSSQVFISRVNTAMEVSSAAAAKAPALL